MAFLALMSHSFRIKNVPNHDSLWSLTTNRQQTRLVILEMPNFDEILVRIVQHKWAPVKRLKETCLDSWVAVLGLAMVNTTQAKLFYLFWWMSCDQRLISSQALILQMIVRGWNYGQFQCSPSNNSVEVYSRTFKEFFEYMLGKDEVKRNSKICFVTLQQSGSFSWSSWSFHIK